MIRYRTYKLNEIMPLISGGKPLRTPKWRVSTFGNRLRTYVNDGIVCNHCGIKGEFFALETHHKASNPHLNLYGRNGDGKEVLMTSDHIVPKSRGGTGNVSNRQCLCTKCNQKKDSDLEQLTFFKVWGQG